MDDKQTVMDGPQDEGGSATSDATDHINIQTCDQQINSQNAGKIQPENPKNELLQTNETEETENESQNNTENQDHGAIGEVLNDSTTTEKIEESEDDLSEGDLEVDVLNVDSPEDMDIGKRNAFYLKGVKMMKKRKMDLALKCFLKCLTGLEETATFGPLPQCLRNVASLYYKKQEYEKAIQFVQAEKMYYETSLIDTSLVKKQLEKRQKQEDKASGEEEKDDDLNSKDDTDDQETGKVDDTSPQSDSADAKMAEEYENLAKMCLEKEQPTLALEYQAKATKLRQQVFGESHDVTNRSLDMFTVIYGEVGKQQYSESMEKIGSDLISGETSSTLRQRKHSNEQQSTDTEESGKFQDRQVKEQEEWIARTLLLVFFGICCVILILVMCYIYCKIDVGSRTCANWKREIYYQFMRFKFFYYHYTSTKETVE